MLPNSNILNMFLQYCKYCVYILLLKHNYAATIWIATNRVQDYTETDYVNLNLHRRSKPIVTCLLS